MRPGAAWDAAATTFKVRLSMDFATALGEMGIAPARRSYLGLRVKDRDDLLKGRVASKHRVARLARSQLTVYCPCGILALITYCRWGAWETG